MNTIKQLEKQINKLRKQQQKIEAEEFKKKEVPKRKKLIGKCYKWNGGTELYNGPGELDGQSCPKFCKVIDVSDNGVFICKTLSLYPDGSFQANPHNYFYSHIYHDRGGFPYNKEYYEEISDVTFDGYWATAIKKLEKGERF